MSDKRALLLVGHIPGDLNAFKPYAPGRMRLHEPLAKAVEWVGDKIAKAADWVIDKVIDPVMTAVTGVIEAALDNPLKTVLQIAAIVTPGMQWTLPLIEGADVAIKGGDLGDVLEATAKAYVMQEVGSYAGKAAGSYASTAAAEAGATAATAKLAGEIVGSAASAGAVAVVSGQDPLKALLAGGIGAAVPAVLGKVDVFKGLPPSAQRVIASAVSAKLSGGNVTAAVINSTIAASNIVADALKSFDPDGTKLDNSQRSILTDVLMGTATAALTGGSPANVISAAMMKAGSKALGEMATSAFKTSTTEATAAYGTASKTADKFDANRAAQGTAADNYNATANTLQTKITEQNRLSGVYNAAVAAHNANPSNETAAAANTAIKTYNDYVTQLNKDYAATYQPALVKYGAELDTLKQQGAVLSGDYEKAIKAFGTQTDKLSDLLDPIYRTSNRAFVEVMDEKFDSEAYKKINGLAADEDPYEHFLSKGQFRGVITNNEAAQPVIAIERARLLNEALTSKGINPTTADPAMVATILGNIDAKYGSNISAMKAASADDVVKWTTTTTTTTTTITKLVTAQQNGTARIKAAQGAWNKPATDTVTVPAGLKLATFESFNSGNATTIYDAMGNTIWVEANPDTAVPAWDPAKAATLPAVVITAKRPTEAERILAISELAGADAVNNVVSQGMINAAKTLVGWAKETGNSGLINTSANIVKATGGFLDSINGMSVLLGVAPKDTKFGKFANTLQDIGKAGNTAEYQASIKNMKSIIGDAKGVGGTLKAIYGAFESAPLQFLAEYVGVEGIQEVAPLLIGGVASAGAKGAALALKYGQAVAVKMGTAAGMTTAIATDIMESAGGAASSAYDETYKAAIKMGKSPVDADKIAMEVAQRQAFVAAATTAVSMGIGGGALEKAVLGRSGTGLGDAMQALGDFAKTGTKITIKEGMSEAGEEGVTQAALEAQLYKIDPTRDVAKEITQAAAFGMIAGGPIAGGAYGASRTGDVISNMSQGNARIADILETNKGNPAAADAELTKYGVTDNTIKSNLMNVVDNANYTSSDEAADKLAARSDYTYSDADVAALTGKGTDGTLGSRVDAYVDPKVLDIEEVKAAAKAEGYTLTDEEAQKLVGQKDEIAAVAAARAEFDPKATMYDEAKGFLTAKGYTPTADEIKQFVGNVAETKAQADAAAYVNPRQVTPEEARKYLTDQGYKPSDADVNRFVGQVNEAEQAKNITAWVDPRVVDKGEVEAAYAALGLKKPTADDVQKLLGQYDETGLAAKAEASLPTARFNSIMAQLEDMGSGGISAEAKAAIDLVRTDLVKSMADTGLEVAKVALKVDTAKADLEKAITTLGTTTEANFTEVDNAIQALRDAGLTAADVKATVDKIVGAAGTDETKATGIYAHIDGVNTKIDNINTLVGAPAEGDTPATGLYAKIAANEAAGMTRDAATQKAIADVAVDLGTTKEALLAQLGTTEGNLTRKIEGLETALTTTEKNILDKVKEYEAAGKTREEATQLAITAVATDLGTTKEALLTALGTTEANLTKSITDLSTQVSDLSTKLGDVETNIYAKMAEYEKTGIGRDEALGKAIADVAANLGTTKEALLTQLGTTETNLKADVAAAETNLGAKITDSQEAILKELGLVKTGLSEEITASEAKTATKIGEVETNILSRVAEYEKAGIGRDEALNKAVDDVAANLGTTRTDILTQIGTTETNLKADIAKSEAALTAKIGGVETTLGRAAQTATPADLDAMIKLLEQQGAYDPQYDYNGDKVIDQNDRVAIETYLNRTPDVTNPPEFAPSAGTKWAPTGVFKTVAEEAAATRQAAADEAERTRVAAAADAEKTRQAQAAAALKTQRMGNLNTLTSMLGQAGDVGGQQVTVKAADPTKIGYVYDFSSIFANPSQEKMFASPFAQGGMVDGSDELNDELLKILKG